MWKTRFLKNLTPCHLSRQKCTFLPQKTKFQFEVFHIKTCFFKVFNSLKPLKYKALHTFSRGGGEKLLKGKSFPTPFVEKCIKKLLEKFFYYSELEISFISSEISTLNIGSLFILFEIISHDAMIVEWSRLRAFPMPFEDISVICLIR